ncbi:AMIN domain-containing protein [Hydrogenimonas sp.]
MRHAPLLLLTLALALFGRENPFRPVIDETVLPTTSNKVEKAPPLKEVKVQLPVDARVLTSVALYYQALDGSIKKEVVAVDRSVDWHRPILITQAPAPGGKPSKEAAKKRAKPVPKKREVKKREAKKAAPARKTKAAPYYRGEKAYRPLPFLAMRFGKDFVRIVTDDPKIRVFHLSDPFKIVIDFKRKAAFLTRHKTLETPPFKAVDIGNHDGYYRLVLTLDAPYRYTVSKIADGYIVHLR